MFDPINSVIDGALNTVSDAEVAMKMQEKLDQRNAIHNMYVRAHAPVSGSNLVFHVKLSYRLAGYQEIYIARAGEFQFESLTRDDAINAIVSAIQQKYGAGVQINL